MMILHFSHTMPAQNSSEGFDNLNSVRLEGYSVKNVAFYNYSHCRILKTEEDQYRPITVQWSKGRSLRIRFKCCGTVMDKLVPLPTIVFAHSLH